MLILGRREKEDILIGNNIRISVENIAKGMVKIGIDAPKDVVILRGELKDSISEANIKASTKVDEDSIKDITKLLQDA